MVDKDENTQRFVVTWVVKTSIFSSTEDGKPKGYFYLLPAVV